jgi:hypothetical protein
MLGLEAKSMERDVEAGGARVPRGRLAAGLPLGLRAFTAELGLAVAGALIYFAVRGAVVDRVGEAMANATDLMSIERTFGLFWEGTLQRWALSSSLVTDLMNGIYFWGHMPVIIVVALGLFWRRRAVYRQTRNAFVVSAVVALVLYATLPVAPPRFFAELGFVDTLALSGGASYQAQEVGPFVNPFAAVPSLHFGWALLLSLGLWRARPGSGRWALLLGGVALLLPVAQFFAVIMTANHFVLDLAAGALVAGLGVGGALWWEQNGGDGGRRLLPRRLIGRAQHDSGNDGDGGES